MLWAPALVLMTVTSAASPGTAASAPLFSTYDDAACAVAPRLAIDDGGAAASTGELASAIDPAASADRDCSPPAAPALIDCNDPGVSLWLGEMIGSCDMPRPSPPTQALPSALRSARGSPSSRVCDGIHCSHDSTPLRPAGRSVDDGASLLFTHLTLGYWPRAVELAASRLTTRRSQAQRDPLERPPRAA